MSAFDFVSHEKFLEDPYIAEAVTLCFDGKYRVTYIRKKMQNGGMFWSEINASVKQHGDKKYLKSFTLDSNFLNEDVKTFLDNRSWEKSVHRGGYIAEKSKENEEIPF